MAASYDVPALNGPGVCCGMELQVGPQVRRGCLSPLVVLQIAVAIGIRPGEFCNEPEAIGFLKPTRIGKN